MAIQLGDMLANAKPAYIEFVYGQTPNSARA